MALPPSLPLVQSLLYLHEHALTVMAVLSGADEPNLSEASECGQNCTCRRDAPCTWHDKLGHAQLSSVASCIDMIPFMAMAQEAHAGQNSHCIATVQHRSQPHLSFEDTGCRIVVQHPGEDVVIWT